MPKNIYYIKFAKSLESAKDILVNDSFTIQSIDNDLGKIIIDDDFVSVIFMKDNDSVYSIHLRSGDEFLCEDRCVDVYELVKKFCKENNCEFYRSDHTYFDENDFAFDYNEL